jgi:hypothetical protein
MLAAAASVARRRRVAPGILITLGGSFVDHVQDVRADRAGAGLRDVAGTPSAPAALQNAKRFRRCHVQRVERAIGRAGPRLDEPLGRDPGEPVTIDLDATQVTVYGRRKQGTNFTAAVRQRLPPAGHGPTLNDIGIDTPPMGGYKEIQPAALEAAVQRLAANAVPS